jgi:sugar phosphate isomerase/epimerase
MLLSTASLSGHGLHKIFSLAAQSEVSGLNLDVNPRLYDTLDTGYVASLSREFSVPVESVTALERDMNADTLRRVFALADAVGAKLVTLYPPHRFDKDTTWFSEDLAKLQKKYPDLVAAVGNVEPKTILFVIPEYRDATLQLIKKATGSTTLDISHVDPESGIDLLKAFTLLGSSIRQVFLSDRDAEGTGKFPGTGEMPVESLLIKLREAGYDGSFALRVRPKELAAGESDEAIIERIRGAEAFLRKYFSPGQ